MKKLITALIAFFLLQTAFAGNLPPTWMIDKFKFNYPNSVDVRWTETPDHYEVRFTENSANCWLILNKTDASVYALVRYYEEPELNPKIDKELHSFVHHATVKYVTEVNMDNKTGYEVFMIGKKYSYIIEINGDNSLSIKNMFKNS